MTEKERCVCGAIIDREKYTICTRCKRNIVPVKINEILDRNRDERFVGKELGSSNLVSVETLRAWIKGAEDHIESGVATDLVAVCPVALAKACRQLLAISAHETSRDETGWLIEVELGGWPHYWKASADARCIGEFDPDANAALRLSREKDGRDLALFLSAKGTIALSDVRKIKITEHMWPCSPVEPTPLIDWKTSYEEALRQRDALTADAARYRFLRDFTYVEAYYIDGAGGVDTKVRVEGSVEHLDLAVDMERIKERPRAAKKATAPRLEPIHMIAGDPTSPVIGHREVKTSEPACTWPACTCPGWSVDPRCPRCSHQNGDGDK
jgi:hypothetical protein